MKKARELQKTSTSASLTKLKSFPDRVDYKKLWKILKETGIPDHLTCLLRNLHGCQATVRTGHGTMDWFQIGKGIWQDWMVSLCLFNLYVEHIMQNIRLDQLKAGIQTDGRDVNNLRYHSNSRKWKGTKEPLDEGERGEWKGWLKTKIMASCPITSWQTEGEKVEAVSDFLFLGSEIIAYDDCSHEKTFGPWKESYNKPRHT